MGYLVIFGATKDVIASHRRRAARPIPTVSYFSRPLCCQELRWAVEWGVFVQPIINFTDKPYISELIDEAPSDLKCIGSVDFIDINRSDPEYFQVGIAKIRRVLKNLERSEEGLARV